MVLKRPKNISGAGPEDETDVELMEHLVKKSLDINPGLRDGRTTQEILEGLRQEAVARSGTADTPPAPSASEKKASLAQRRRSTIEFFFEQKTEEFNSGARDVRARMRGLEKDLAALQRSTRDEMVDFLALLAGGADSPEAREVMRSHRNFLKELGCSDADIIAAAKKRS